MIPVIILTSESIAVDEFDDINTNAGRDNTIFSTRSMLAANIPRRISIVLKFFIKRIQKVI